MINIYLFMVWYTKTMNITIHNPNNLPLIDYRQVVPIQGELKDLTKANYDKLKAIIIKRGFYIPLYIWIDNGQYKLLDGTQRLRVMMQESIEPYEVPYIVIEAENEQEAKAKLLEITSQYGTVTQEGFDNYLALAELPEIETLEVINFDALQFGKEIESEVEEDDPPKLDESKPPKSKIGDIYQLGRHKLMCGNATKIEEINLLMDDEKADMIFTDPPFDMTADKLVLIGLAIEKFCNGNIFIIAVDWQARVWLQSFYRWNFRSFNIIDCGINTLQSFGHYFNASHLIVLHFYFNKMNATNECLKYKTIIDIKEFRNMIGKNEDEKFISHAKPISLPTQYITSFECKNVLDLFGGSGSTLIACEQAGKSCYMMELDPNYCDVIRKRYWKFTHDNNEEGWEDGTIQTIIIRN